MKTKFLILLLFVFAFIGTSAMACGHTKTIVYPPNTCTCPLYPYCGTCAVPPPTVNILVNGVKDALIPIGGTATVSWSSTYASLCTLSFNGTRATSGSISIADVRASQVFTITCVNSANVTVSDTARVNVFNPVPEVVLLANGSRGPITIPYNTPVKLSWESKNSTYCTASGDWYDAKPLNGSETTARLTGRQIFTITCTGPEGQATSTVIVNIQAPAYTSVDIRANGSDGPITVLEGSAVILSWNSLNVSYCYASGSWSGDKMYVGSETKTNVKSTKTYTINCTGPGGPTTDFVKVYVQKISKCNQTKCQTCCKDKCGSKTTKCTKCTSSCNKCN